MNKEETNRIIRDSFNNILNYEPTGKELVRKKQIYEIARKEKEDYEQRKAEFYNNPLHWSNNKRRRYGLSVLRGRANKCRAKRYPSFRPTTRLFCTLEDVIEEALTDKLKSNEFFNKFVDYKDMNLGDAKVFYVGE